MVKDTYKRVEKGLMEWDKDTYKRPEKGLMEWDKDTYKRVEKGLMDGIRIPKLVIGGNKYLYKRSEKVDIGVYCI